jgi:hypothetical protein
MAVIHGVLEHVLASCVDPRIGAVWNREMRKLPLLQNVCDFLHPAAFQTSRMPWTLR